MNSAIRLPRVGITKTRNRAAVFQQEVDVRVCYCDALAWDCPSLVNSGHPGPPRRTAEQNNESPRLNLPQPPTPPPHMRHGYAVFAHHMGFDEWKERCHADRHVAVRPRGGAGCPGRRGGNSGGAGPSATMGRAAGALVAPWPAASRRLRRGRPVGRLCGPAAPATGGLLCSASTRRLCAAAGGLRSPLAIGGDQHPAPLSGRLYREGDRS